MKRTVLAVALTATLALGACGSGDSGGGSGTGSDGGSTLDVTAAFYPLAYAVERVGGDHVTVRTITKAGAEPHDVELTPKDVVELSTSALVVYEKGFQPAVDQAVTRLDADRSLDVASAVDLTLKMSDDGHDHGAPESDATGSVDPHFWLDPTRYAKAVEAIADGLARVDAGHATAYRDNAATFVAELTALDREFSTTLATCTSRDLVTGHAAFAYLADRYDLHQEGIAGLSPDAEPDAATMKQIVDHIREHKVRTVYAETLANPELTDTIARESGAKVAVLDPLEGLTDTSAGTNYLEVMRSNLATLRAGQGCS